MIYHARRPPAFAFLSTVNEKKRRVKPSLRASQTQAASIENRIRCNPKWNMPSYNMEPPQHKRTDQLLPCLAKPFTHCVYCVRLELCTWPRLLCTWPRLQPTFLPQRVTRVTIHWNSTRPYCLLFFCAANADISPLAPL